VSGQQDLDTILKIALDNVLEIINGTIGGILLLDEDAKTLRYRVQHGLSAKFVENVKLSLGEGIAGRVAQSGEPTLSEDLSKGQIGHDGISENFGVGEETILC
jgi:signal transduction protein with GAF and PtsI domain